jgi:hypothetical protein
MQIGRASDSTQTAVVDLPLSLRCRLVGKGLKRGFDRFEGNDPAPVSAVSQRFTELADVCSHIDDYVNLAVFNKIDQIPNSPTPEMDNPETLVCGPYKPIHLVSTPLPIFPIVHLNGRGA